MGRRKIAIKCIKDPKLRHSTFNKRKNGLIKKAAEISLLCDLKLLLIFEDPDKNIIRYSTHGKYQPEEYFANLSELNSNDCEEFSSKDYPNFFKVNHYRKTLEKMQQEKEDTVSFESSYSNSEEADDDDQNFCFEELVVKKTITTRRQLELQAKKLMKADEPDVLPFQEKICKAKNQKTEQTNEPADKNLNKKKLNLKIPLSISQGQNQTNSGTSNDMNEEKILNNTGFVVSALDYKISIEDRPLAFIDSPFGFNPTPLTLNDLPKNSSESLSNYAQNKNISAPKIPREGLISPFILPTFTPSSNSKKGPAFDFLLSTAKKDLPVQESKDPEDQGKNKAPLSSGFDFSFVNFSLPMTSPGFLYSNKGFTSGALDSNSVGRLHFKSFTFDEAFIEGEDKNQAYGDVVEKRVHKNFD